MIFNNLFKPKWQHQDTNIRLQAVKALDAVKDKSALIAVINEDQEDKVVLAALNKLNEAKYWLNSLQSNRGAHVKQLANKKLLDAALGNSEIGLQPAETEQFLSQLNHTQSLESLLKSDISFQQKKLILEKLNRPHLYVQLLTELDDLKQQEDLLVKINDEASLNKLLKKSNSQALQQKIKSKLDTLKEAKQKPLIIEKQAKLVLAKLNSLREQTNLDELDQQRQLLNDDWQALNNDFQTLETAISNELSEKFVDIDSALNKARSNKQQAWNESVAAKKQSDARKFAINEAENALQNISKKVIELAEQGAQQLEQDISNNLHSLLDSATEKLMQLNDTDERIENLHNRISSAKQTIQQLPELLSRIASLDAQLQALNANQPPQSRDELSEKQSWYNEWKDLWESQLKQLGLSLPQHLNEQFESITKYWHQSFADLRQVIRKDFNFAQNKLRSIQDLIEQGKFNAAIGLFNKVKTVVAQLPDKEQNLLQRSYSQVEETISELQDWREYIAVPKKQELLDKILHLVKEPMTSVIEQAQQVKNTRATWNSLGNLNNDDDKAINAAFDEACEQAFAPCRDYYAEQEKLRAENLKRKYHVIEQFESLKQQIPDNKLMDNQQISQYNSLQSQWNGIGDVDKSEFKVLTNKYHTVIDAFKKQLEATLNDNARCKSQLIKQAEALKTLDDIQEAVNQAKAIQAKWQDIGFAGQKQERELWKAFRAANDEIFSRFAEQNEEIRIELDKNLQLAEKIIDELNQVIEATDVDLLNKQLSEAENRFSNVGDLPHKKRKTIESAFATAKKSIQNRLVILAKQQKLKHYETLFALLSAVELDTFEQELNSADFPDEWKQIIQQEHQQAINNSADKRRDIVIKVELLAGLTSPESDNQRRQQIQVEMLAEKLQQGATEDLDSLLIKWLAAGSVAEIDTSEVDRLKKAYLK